ncbi:hypothetical protein CHLNCDRAFT_35180 [Chlorella variabilis]|uniref:PPM-type phosphatase domain-containing protein n=1 Tax=Chlorella variabilis TaxID=554065 RepID=E1ZCI0_CHLVA|nr:hypothetical protein CHLNCDRAFT_35180 [Chlorella variabilis]EFN56436.1 hypothetical protein CHLNCDRAFT_35180 [Chlorella variabilis]|eukprot:XP_005848538.1 hypothetical protein CHLNCDRAFT_35180 [Chlorella variabilis]
MADTKPPNLWKSLFSWALPDSTPSSRELKYYNKLTSKYGLVSGACQRPDGQVACGWASLRGKRPMNEDTVYCSFQRHDETGEDVGCFGVFDGHGGPSAARFVRDNLFTNLLNHQMFSRNLAKAVADAYAETDGQYIDLDAEQQRDDGCTAVTAVLVGKRLVVAHVGDSRAVLSVGSGAVALSQDHKPNREDERGRIEDAGGQVVWAGTWRVSGVLAVSRSFGNRMMKQYIIPHPEIREDILNHKNQCLVLASDGLWDAMDNHEATRLAMQYREQGAEAAARALVAEGYTRGSQDNISALVVFFHLDASTTSKTSTSTSQQAD